MRSEIPPRKAFNKSRKSTKKERKIPCQKNNAKHGILSIVFKAPLSKLHFLCLFNRLPPMPPTFAHGHRHGGLGHRTDVRCPSRTAPPDPFQNHQQLLEVRTKTEVRRPWMLDGCQVPRNVAPRRFYLCCACPCLCSSCNHVMLVLCSSPF